MNCIIQSSAQHTASTVLVNLLHGLFSPEEPVASSTRLAGRDQFCHLYNGKGATTTSPMHPDHLTRPQPHIQKTHNLNFPFWAQKYKEYNLYFVCSTRPNHPPISAEYAKWNNVLIFSFAELNETNTHSLDDICNNFYNKCVNFFPRQMLPQGDEDELKSQIKKRITGMNQRYQEIKHESFGVTDPLYQIHGHHRGRDGA